MFTSSSVHYYYYNNLYFNKKKKKKYALNLFKNLLNTLIYVYVKQKVLRYLDSCTT